MEKIKVSLPIVVEGRYDKSTLSGFVDATIITTDGFSIFNNKEKQLLVRRLCADGAIILTDSDGGGKQIRSFLSGIVGSDKIYNLYIPKISGKEKRKQKPSAAGTLGVEGMSREVLSRLLEPFSVDKDIVRKGGISKTDFFIDGLSGGENSSLKRARLAHLAGLPDDISANALLEALNILYSYDEYKALLAKTENAKKRGVKIDESRCFGCKICAVAAYCPSKAVYFENGKARLDESKCTDCKVCIGKCPFGAFPEEI